jgi:carbon monoxide dehydrogenase subunit G
MASIRKEFIVRCAPEQVWSALRDFGAVDRKLAAGFVTACLLEDEDEGPVRLVTFANGMQVRERLVALDETQRRLVYTAQGGRATHHNASAQAIDAGDGSTRFVWITDLLPDSVAPAVEAMMDAGVKAMRATLEGQAAA